MRAIPGERLSPHLQVCRTARLILLQVFLFLDVDSKLRPRLLERSGKLLALRSQPLEAVVQFGAGFRVEGLAVVVCELRLQGMKVSLHTFEPSLQSSMPLKRHGTPHVFWIDATLAGPALHEGTTRGKRPFPKFGKLRI